MAKKKKNNMTAQDRLLSMESDLVREISGGFNTEPIVTEGPTRTYGVAGQTVDPGPGGTMRLTPNPTRTYGVAGQNVAPGPGGTMVLTPNIRTSLPAKNPAAVSTTTNVNTDNKIQKRDSAFRILADEFRRYGFDDPEFFNQLEGLIRRDISDAEIRIEVRKLPAYNRRFGAIKRRIDKGLSAISEAEYLQLEDQYANTMRRFGMPEAYYTKQVGRTNPTFDSLIEFDVSPVELEDRLMMGQKRVMEAAPQVRDTIRQFYGDAIKDGDVLAFVVDPKNALEQIRRKVTAAEIGAGAAQAGLTTTRQRAEELGAYGVTGEQARQGFQTVAEIAPRGSQLASIYREEPYTQTEIEAEVFGTAGAVEARKRRERLTARERSAFSGTSGAFQGALSRDRQGAF